MTNTKPDAAAVAYWARHSIAPGAKPKLCPYCGHTYLMPCADDEWERCQNYAVAKRRRERSNV
jgi:hypothetical protein